jgi:hypothetical protein
MKLSTESFRKSFDIDDFVESSRLIVEDYKCSLCLGIYNNPVVDTCGHVFCKSCIIKFFETEKACPISGWKLEEANVSTLVIVNEILKRQSVLCKNRSMNCNWIGKLAELESHIASECQMQPVKCPYEQCSAEIPREGVERHKSICEFRIIECQYCKTKLVNSEIDSHPNVCPLYKISCPQNCNELIERKYIEIHLAGHCIYSNIDCPYKEYGCQTKLIRKDLNEYMTSNMNKHNLLVLIWLSNFQQNILENTVSFKETLSSLETKVKKIEENLASFDVLNKTEYVYKDDESSCSNEVVQKKTNKKSIYTSKLNTQEEKKDLVNVSEKFTNKKRMRVRDTNKNTKSSFMELSEDEKKISSGSSSCSPLYSVIGYTADGKRKKEHVFDVINISKGIEVLHTRATCLPQNKNEHRFVFANLILNEKDTEWRIIINAASPWIALGMCIKDQVISNRFRFISNSPNFNHSFFGVSSNGYLWNANNQTENNFFITNFPTITKGDILMFKYLPSQKELYYRVSNKINGKLTNVYASKGGFLTPCIVFLNPGDEVLLETN